MIIQHYSPTFAKGSNEPTTVRNLSTTRRKIDIQKQLENVEQQMMSFAYKVNRADKQREERRNKR